LETLRQYARERLVARGEAECFSRAHAAYFLGLAEELESGLAGPAQKSALGRFETEHDNLRAAVAWWTESGEAEGALRITAALGRVWHARRYFTEGAEQLARALARPGAEAPSLARVRALARGAYLTSWTGDEARAGAMWDEADALARALGAHDVAALGLAERCLMRFEDGDRRAVLAIGLEALEMARLADDPRTMAIALQAIGAQELWLGERESARARLTECVALLRRQGDRLAQIPPLASLGRAALLLGDLEAARAWCEESLAIARDLVGRRGSADAMELLGLVLLTNGELDRARTLIRESLVIRYEVGNLSHMWWGFMRLAGVASAEGRWERTLRLGGAAEVGCEAVDIRMPPSLYRTQVECWFEAARAGLGPVAAAAAWERGRAMTLEGALAYALRDEDG
jgi:tetratricopeptide (TPR) repeat protein